MEGNAQESADSQFAGNIRIARGLQGRSQTWLAQQMVEHGHRWQQSTVARIEAAQQPVKLAEAITLAEIFGTTVDGLLKPSEESAEAAAVAQAERNVRGTAEVMAHAAQRHAEARAGAAEVAEVAAASQYESVREAAARLAAMLGGSLQRTEGEAGDGTAHAQGQPGIVDQRSA